MKRRCFAGWTKLSLKRSASKRLGATRLVAIRRRQLLLVWMKLRVACTKPAAAEPQLEPQAQTQNCGYGIGIMAGVCKRLLCRTKRASLAAIVDEVGLETGVRMKRNEPAELRRKLEEEHKAGNACYSECQRLMERLGKARELVKGWRSIVTVPMVEAEVEYESKPLEQEQDQEREERAEVDNSSDDAHNSEINS